MKTRLITMVLLGVALLLVGFITELVVSDEKTWATRTYGDSRILLPLSESFRILNVTEKKSVLQILVSANSTLIIYVLHDEKAEWAWEDVEFKRNVLLLDVGTWTVRILNNNTIDYCHYTSTIVLKEPHIKQAKPYIWLRTPLLILGMFSISLTAPMYFFNRFRSRLDKEKIEIFVAVAIIFTLIFSYQIAGFVLQTSTPWVVCEGVSMETAINFGDLVIIAGTKAQDLAADDVILFRKIALVMGKEDFSTLSVPVLHRIVYINRVGGHWYFGTKGDNNERLDEWYVPDEGVLGKAVLVLPKIGYVVLMLERIEIKLLIIGIIIVLVFIWPEVRRKKRQSAISSKKNEIGCHGESGGSKRNHSVHILF